MMGGSLGGGAVGSLQGSVQSGWNGCWPVGLWGRRWPGTSGHPAGPDPARKAKERVSARGSGDRRPGRTSGRLWSSPGASVGLAWWDGGRADCSPGTYRTRPPGWWQEKSPSRARQDPRVRCVLGRSGGSRRRACPPVVLLVVGLVGHLGTEPVRSGYWQIVDQLT
jgi:hypothetical protein